HNLDSRNNIIEIIVFYDPRSQEIIFLLFVP
ncbi:unnamed protein product, partial [marine sediment metagenome]